MLYQPLGIDAGGSGCNAAFPFDKGVLMMKKMNYPADYAVLSNEEMTYTTGGGAVDDAAGTAALVGFLLQAAYVLALLEVEVVVEAVAVDVGGHPCGRVLGGTQAQTVQAKAELVVVLALAVFAARVHFTEQQLPVVASLAVVPVHGHTAAKVLHDDAAILAAGDVDGVAVAVAGLVDGVGDDLKNRMGAALHTVRPEDDGRAFADAVRTL